MVAERLGLSKVHGENLVVNEKWEPWLPFFRQGPGSRPVIRDIRGNRALHQRH